MDSQGLLGRLPRQHNRLHSQCTQYRVARLQNLHSRIPVRHGCRVGVVELVPKSTPDPSNLVACKAGIIQDVAVLDIVDVAPPEVLDCVQQHVEKLDAYWNGGQTDDISTDAVLESIATITQTVQDAVNSRSPGLRGLQSRIISSDAFPALVHVAQHYNEPTAYKALQILCYRNSVAGKKVAHSGIVAHVAASLSVNPVIRSLALPEDSGNAAWQASLDLACSQCFLLSSLVAFCDASHTCVVDAGLIPLLVTFCRTAPSGAPSSTSLSSALSSLSSPNSKKHVVVTSRTAPSATLLQIRAASVLRNLAHNPSNHVMLKAAGAVAVLADIMRTEQDPSLRIHAAVAVACLVGQEEHEHQGLLLSTQLVEQMLEVLAVACTGGLAHGTFWTVWKLCQGLATLTINDKNKEVIVASNGVPVLSEVLLGRHHNTEAAQRYALSALWNLAFCDTGKAAIQSTPGLIEAMRDVLATAESPKTKEVAKGALWTLGLTEDIRHFHRHAHHLHGMHTVQSESEEEEEEIVQLPNGTCVLSCEVDGAIPHIMLSYEWSSQQTVMLLKTSLQQAGYATWMDIDRMSGSTLEAMACAVEESAVVLVCVSKRYKESQACRTEAEYAFQRKKRIIPIMMEQGYKPTGWLGALLGTRLYINLSDPRSIAAKMPLLIRELGNDGKAPTAGLLPPPIINPSLGMPPAMASVTPAATAARPDTWTHAEVAEWLRSCDCEQYVDAFLDNDMDGRALSGLYRMHTDARLQHELLSTDFGIASIGHRLRLIDALHRLFSGSN